MNKQAFIMMGPSGGGKSTWVKENTEPKDTLICSSDDYPGLYGEDGKFNFGLLASAHAHCLREFIEAITYVAKDVVVCDNTNTTIGEIAPYIAVAQAHGYDVRIVACWDDKDVCSKRNVHGVPEKAVGIMIERMSKTLGEWPRFWPKITTREGETLTKDFFETASSS